MRNVQGIICHVGKLCNVSTLCSVSVACRFCKLDHLLLKQERFDSLGNSSIGYGQFIIALVWNL